MTTVALVNNSSTFLIVILGYFLLKECSTWFTCVTLALSFLGTILVLIFEEPETRAEPSTHASGRGDIISLVMLVSNPLIIAVGVISMR